MEVQDRKNEENSPSALCWRNLVFKSFQIFSAFGGLAPFSSFRDRPSSTSREKKAINIFEIIFIAFQLLPLSFFFASLPTSPSSPSFPRVPLFPPSTAKRTSKCSAVIQMRHIQKVQHGEYDLVRTTLRRFTCWQTFESKGAHTFVSALLAHSY